LAALPREKLRRSLEIVHFGLTAKYQLTAALARLREIRGDPRSGLFPVENNQKQILRLRSG
jgi:hypothetical protein